VVAETGPAPLKTRDAVDTETPARAATAARVGRGVVLASGSMAC
jgi:hypothetical protein